MVFKTKNNAYFKENLKLYDPMEFIGVAAQHNPVPRVRLIQHFGLYSSKSRGKWEDWDHVIKHAPEGRLLHIHVLADTSHILWVEWKEQ